MTTPADLHPTSGADTNRKMRQFRERGCNSRTGTSPAAGGDTRSKQRPRQELVRDPQKTRPRDQGGYTTTASEITRHAAAAAVASPPPPPPLPPPPPPLPHPCTPSISSWRAIFSEDYGKFYFYNPNTGETTWEPPKKSAGVRGVTGQTSVVVNRNMDAGRGAVTVRSRSLVTLSKGGKLERQVGSAVSLQSDGGRHAHTVQPREGVWGTADETGKKGHAAGIRANNSSTSVRSMDHQATAVRGRRPLSGKLAETRKGEQSRARLKKSFEEGGDRTKQELASKRQSTKDPEETTPVPSRRRGAETPRPKDNERRSKLKSKSPAPSSQATRVASSLLRAENWLAQNEPEVEVENPRSRTLARSDRVRPRPGSSRGATTEPSRKPQESSDERVQADTPEGPSAKPTRLRGRAAAVWASVQAQHREEEEMTGKPEITRRGRSKQRSVDDLFLFQRNVEASRRRKRDAREAHESNLVTGRPETCGRSAALVDHMRKANADRTQLSTSKRLYGNAREMRRRQETLQMQVDTAIRRRANPTLSARSRSLPRSRNRSDAARRLYEQALASRDEALQRERSVTQNLPRGVTFHPKIHHRSAVLAQRRRERWAAAVGLDVPGSEGGSVATTADASAVGVQEFLLAEGALYDRRRRERQSRQEQLALRSKSPTVNRHSRLLLRKAERISRSIGTPAESRVPEDVAADVAHVRDHEFSPRLEALDTSKKMLESRYGRGSIPPMEQREKERERERLEKEAQLDERNKENRNFVARRIVRQSPESGSAEQCPGVGIYERTKEHIRQKENRWASEREALRAEELADCTFAPEFRTKRRGRSRYRQRAAGPASSLAGAVSGVDDAHEVGHAVCTSERGGSTNNIFAGFSSGGGGSGGSGGNGGGGGGGARREAERSGGLPTRRRRCPTQQTAIEGRGTGGGPSSFFREGDAGGITGSCGDCSVGSVGEGGSKSDYGKARSLVSDDGRHMSSLMRRRRSGEVGSDDHSSMQDDYSVYESTEDEDGSDHFLLRTGDTAATAPSASASNNGGNRHGSTRGLVGTREGTPGGDVATALNLPPGWTAFTSPEGWKYFFHEETSIVQWKRPT